VSLFHSMYFAYYQTLSITGDYNSDVQGISNSVSRYLGSSRLKIAPPNDEEVHCGISRYCDVT
jgi:hypothetical protein